MRSLHFSYFSTTLLLISSLSMICGCEFDVTRDPKYQHGWVPGHQYELRRTMALVLNKQNDDVYFNPYRADKKIGEVLGTMSDYDQILVENSPAGTRFRVDKLIRYWNPLSTITYPVGTMLSGSCRGKTVQLYSVSQQDEIGNDEFVDRRDDDLVSPISK